MNIAKLLKTKWDYPSNRPPSKGGGKYNPTSKLTPSCNACDVIDWFCEENEMGYCKDCHNELLREEGGENEQISRA
jgi:hypothetical protein